MENIVIIGASGHAKVIIDIVERQGKYTIVGLLDQNRKPGEEVLFYQVLGRQDDLPELMHGRGLRGILVAIGDNSTRSKVAAQVRETCPDLPFVSAIHPNASIARDVAIGEGTVIMAGAAVNPCCSIGRFCILNTNSSLDHDSTMEDYSSLAPRAATGGNCRIGTYSALGIGATLIHGVQIGEHTVIGAGATVLGHVGAFKVAYGTPAKTIRQRERHDSYLKPASKVIRNFDELPSRKLPIEKE